MTAQRDAAIKAMARETEQHVAGLGSKPGTLNTERDDSGLRCSCGNWSQGADERGFRPWSAFSEHVVTAAYDAALPLIVGPLRELVEDLAEHGLRFDLNPTMPMHGPTGYLDYIERMDKHAREIGTTILDALPGATS